MAGRAQVQELKEKMRTEREKLIAAVRALREEDLRRVPVDATGEEQWTVLEQLAHLWEMERAYDTWVLAALETENPSLEDIPVEPVAIPIEKANESSRDELLQALALQRSYTLGLIDGIPLASFERTATSPIFGTLTVLQWLRSFYRHDRQHCAQIEGRPSDYRPRFRGPEPNQRRMRLERLARQQDEG